MFLNCVIVSNLSSFFVTDGLQDNKSASDEDSDSDEDEVTPVQVNCHVFWFSMNAY